MKVFIVILNFDGGKDIFECLDSLKDEEVNIVVVDNGSRDGTLEKLKVQSKKLKVKKLIENKRNLGFAAGCNVGIRHALEKGAEAVLLLNQDTVVERGFLKPLIKNPAGIVAPVIKFKRKWEWVYDFGGRINWLFGKTSHVEKKKLLDKKSNDSNYRTGADYVSGCCMLVGAEVFEKIGLFDEKYFLYFEDVDFCLRARKAGFKVAVEPKSMVLHRLAEKSRKPLGQHLVHLKSNLIFINSYLPLYRRPVAYFYLCFLGLKIIWNQLVVK